ncbi:hypothetical protein DKK76_09060 [Frischella perrara]|uniref:Bacterial CdiA-CT RNAse A domain-containing protein n=1 Tax=Frischella perrara TaxID=1267021 RepID=A0A318N772_FRIPE|nr:hypothetical protein DKK76_09060 [Frischella perrara]
MNQDPYLSKDLDYLLTSSSFKDRTTAEAIKSKAINRNQSKINNYLFGNQIGYLVINYKSSSPIGISISKGQTNTTQVSNARIIIARAPCMPTGYKIITEYPTP